MVGSMNKIDNVQQFHMLSTTRTTTKKDEEENKLFIRRMSHKSSTNHFKLEVSSMSRWFFVLLVGGLIACREMLLTIDSDSDHQ